MEICSTSGKQGCIASCCVTCQVAMHFFASSKHCFWYILVQCMSRPNIIHQVQRSQHVWSPPWLTMETCHEFDFNNKYEIASQGLPLETSRLDRSDVPEYFFYVMFAMVWDLIISWICRQGSTMHRYMKMYGWEVLMNTPARNNMQRVWKLVSGCSHSQQCAVYFLQHVPHINVGFRLTDTGAATGTSESQSGYPGPRGRDPSSWIAGFKQQSPGWWAGCSLHGAWAASENIGEEWCQIRMKCVKSGERSGPKHTHNCPISTEEGVWASLRDFLCSWSSIKYLASLCQSLHPFLLSTSVKNSLSSLEQASSFHTNFVCK